MSKVYFSKDINQAVRLFELAGLDKLFSVDDQVALKIHFGEPGNTAFLKPQEVDPIKDKVKSLGGKPFYTDCNTLYRGRRSNAQEHLEVAREHGYSDIIIPENEDSVQVEVNLKHFKKVFLGGTVSRVNTIITLTHFKGHELSGFGGAIKNLGMGFASRQGKLKQHQDCANCKEIKTCKRNQTIDACWIGPSDLVQEKIVEYAYGALKGKKCGFVNYIIRVSPQCDCYGFNEKPIVPDIGVLVSTDPVAIDQASADLVNKTAGFDVFRKTHQGVNWETQLKYAEEIGLGNRKYELIS